MKTFIITLSLFLVTSAFSQSINNTLGTGGVFRIKDASSNFFTLSQSTGEVNILNSLRLENTVSPTIGVMYKGSNRFLHNFGNRNTFLGTSSGNFTMTTSEFNTGVGFSSLISLTTGDNNSAFGYQSLNSNSTGSNNTAIGYNSMFSTTSANYNSAFGYQSLFSNTTGSNNTAIGSQTLSGKHFRF
ncbi:MAG: hypothetical protein IPL16_09590 [Ignavibacteria bacterium]|nr:hypothetical protein [Ignavibacteria bacterium]